jgi:hypothetical protein
MEDPMTRYQISVLDRRRVLFDPADAAHMMEFAAFVKYKTWRSGCPFYLEEPYTDIPTMLYTKVAEYSVRKLLEQV